MADLRAYTSWRTHFKRTKLVRRLGLAGDIAIRELWAWCAEPGNGHTDGELSGMTNEDIAIAADNYAGDADELVETLVDLKLLDGSAGAYCVHDWLEWQPWAANHKPRAESARISALLKWHGQGKHVGAPRQDCPECTRTENHANRSADRTKIGAVGCEPHCETGDSQCSDPISVSVSDPIPPAHAKPHGGEGVDRASAGISAEQLEEAGRARWGKLRGSAAGEIEGLQPFTAAELAEALDSNAESWAYVVKVIRSSRRPKKPKRVGRATGPPEPTPPGTTPAREVLKNLESSWEPQSKQSQQAAEETRRKLGIDARSASAS